MQSCSGSGSNPNQMGLGSSKSREKILVTKPQILICDLVTLWSRRFLLDSRSSHGVADRSGVGPNLGKRLDEQRT